MNRYNFTILEKIGMSYKIRVNSMEIERHKIRTHPGITKQVGEAIELLLVYSLSTNLKIETDSFIYVIERA